jgi:hypothetical protein
MQRSLLPALIDGDDDDEGDMPTGCWAMNADDEPI